VSERRVDKKAVTPRQLVKQLQELIDSREDVADMEVTAIDFEGQLFRLVEVGTSRMHGGMVLFQARPYDGLGDLREDLGTIGQEILTGQPGCIVNGVRYYCREGGCECPAGSRVMERADKRRERWRSAARDYLRTRAAAQPSPYFGEELEVGDLSLRFVTLANDEQAELKAQIEELRAKLGET
jgi:hypothetical protein